MARINLRNVTPVLTNMHIINIHGNTVEEELMLQEVDRVFDEIDTFVELGLSLTDFINLIEFRKTDSGDIYFKNTNSSTVASAIDNKFTLWANDDIDGDNYLNALQLRICVLRNGVYFVSGKNPNKNELTNEYDGNNISLIMYKYIADCLIHRPDALSIFTNIEANKKSLISSNSNSVGTQFINKLFEHSENPTDKTINDPNEYSSIFNPNLLSIYEQLIAICPKRFDSYDLSDFSKLPFREGDTIGIKLKMKGSINGTNGPNAIHKIMSRGMPSIDKPTTYEYPINVVFNDTNYPDKYNIRDSTYLVKFRLTESHEDRIIRNNEKIQQNTNNINEILELFYPNSYLLRICRDNIQIYNDSYDTVYDELELFPENESLINQYNNILLTITDNNDNIIEYIKNMNNMLENNKVSLKILFNEIYSLTKKKEKLEEYTSPEMINGTRKERSNKNIEIINSCNDVYDDSYEYFNNIYHHDIFLYTIDTGETNRDKIYTAIIIGFEEFKNSNDIQLAKSKIDEHYSLIHYS
tara:strand:- start:9746 stop:11323 length:1578 start_codon:yes stop_codon:yes gene_type:complete